MRIFICYFFFSISLCFADSRPNILLIFADDLSWSDLGCYGNDWIQTPNLDRLAKNGMQFTNAYSAAPICSASRAGLLTGKTPSRLGFEFVTKNEPGGQKMATPLKSPPFTLNLSLGEKTIAEQLNDVGYSTAFFGKWHLNQHYKRYLGWSPSHGPSNHGFNVAIDDFGSHPYAYWRNKEARVFDDLKTGEFPKDTLTDQAIEWLQKEHEKPFFCLLSHYYVHDPVHTRMKWLRDQYRNSNNSDLVANYAAMVTTLDHQVGRVLNSLEKSGLLDDTLIVFTSDNGGHPNYQGNAPLRGSKWNLYEGGIRVPLIARWQSHIKSGSQCDTPIISLDLYETFCELANKKTSTATDSRSILPLLKGVPLSNKKLYWHFPYYHPERNFAKSPEKIGVNDGVTSQTRPHSAIRDGQWKLLWFHKDDRVELYDLSKDIAELNDLSETNSKVAEQMATDLKNYLGKVNARMPTQP